jgi:hypothetical protein
MHTFNHIKQVFIMVHPLLGYVHKDMALKLLIMSQQYVTTCVFTVLDLTISTIFLIPVRLIRSHQDPQPTI